MSVRCVVPKPKNCAVMKHNEVKDFLSTWEKLHGKNNSLSQILTYCLSAMPDDLTRRAICDILSEYYSSVEKDYVETVLDDDHIYYAFRRVQKWLENNANCR